MTRWLDPQKMAPLAAALLAVLLAVLAVLQHRWIAEVSLAERQRMREGLEAAAERLASEVDHELGRALFSFHPQPNGREEDRRMQLVRQLQAWRATAPFPELVRDLLVASRRGAGPVELERLDAETGQFAPAEWPPDLLAVRGHLARQRLADASAADLVESTAPALLLPLIWPPRRGAPPPERGVVVLRLDREFLAKELIPQLVESWFGSTGGDLLVAVMAPDGPVYLSDPALPLSRYLPGDVAVPLLGVHRLLGAGFGRGHRGDVQIPAEQRFARSAGEGLRRLWREHHRSIGEPRRAEGLWRVVATHRAGSLEIAVNRARHRNMSVSAAVLLLLAASLAVMAVAGQRASRVARQQMELVAGVTHELNTPLAAIRSAGQNLADGVVSDPAQVRRYGTLIEREGSRLTSLVAKALELAGIQSGTKVYRPEPVSLAEVVEEALAASRWALEEKEFQIESDLPDDLPPVLADRGALRLVIQNLVDNAVKYAADGRWIRFRARSAVSGRLVLLTVEDHGPGIRSEDRPHLFEPFFRGHHRGAPVPGSGLGLSLVRQVVEAQGGRISVGPGPGGRGSAFEVRLPAARPGNGEETA